MHTPRRSGGSVKDCNLMVREILQKPCEYRRRKRQKIKNALTSKHPWNLKGTKGDGGSKENQIYISNRFVASENLIC